MRVFRASVLVSMVLGTAGWLMADIPDPGIRLAIPGGGSTPLCVPDKGLDSCTTILSEAIGGDGFGSVDIKNVNKFAATVMNFFFQTDNLDQPFSASTTDFGIVSIHRHFACESECIDGTLEVDFSGTGPEFTHAGSDSVPAIPCDFDGCSVVGFRPGSDIRIDITYAAVSDPPSCVDGFCDGLQPGEDARISTFGDVPEPGSFVLLLGAAGLLAIKRRFTFYRG